MVTAQGGWLASRSPGQSHCLLASIEHVNPGPQAVFSLHPSAYHCGTQALLGPNGSNVVMSRKQLSPGPQSELLWQGSDMHVPAGPPSDVVPDDSQSNPFGQSVSAAHALVARASRVDNAAVRRAEQARSQQEAKRVFMAAPYPSRASCRHPSRVAQLHAMLCTTVMSGTSKSDHVRWPSCAMSV
jgi:hypothetical protein